MKHISGVKFGMVLKFIHQNDETKSVESACIHMFSLQTEDKESGLWWVNTATFIEKIVPCCDISGPLVTAKDDEDLSKLWILNYRKSKLDSV